MSGEEQAIPGNGSKLVMHGKDIEHLFAELAEIKGDVKAMLPKLYVHEQRIADMNAWKTWASGLGGSVLLTMLGLLIAHVMG